MWLKLLVLSSIFFLFSNCQKNTPQIITQKRIGGLLQINMIIDFKFNKKGDSVIWIIDTMRIGDKYIKKS